MGDKVLHGRNILYLCFELCIRNEQTMRFHNCHVCMSIRTVEWHDYIELF